MDANLGSSIVGTFVEAIGGVAKGIATTVVDVFDTVFLTADGNISSLAIYGLVFGAIGLGIFLVRKFTSKVG